jgi:RNA polymerase primary sigma factor
MDFANLHNFVNTDSPSDPLTIVEEKEMIRRYQKNGDSEARQRLIESNIRFVVKMSLNYRNKGLALSDLIQEGNLGLIEALERFDPGKECRLITYASWWIRLRLQRSLEQKAFQVNMPINKLDVYRKIRAFEKSFEVQKGRRPYSCEIAQEFEIEEKKVIELLNAEISFQTLHAMSEEHPGLETILVDENNIDPRDQIWEEEAKEKLDTAFQVLSQRERDVLQHRYTVSKTGKKMSLRKVGQLLGLSAEGVRRIEEQAMGKLRRPCIMAKMEALFAA